MPGQSFCPHCGLPLRGDGTTDAARRSDVLRRDLQDAFADSYRISELLGEGGFSMVYLAQDLRRRDREVALKVLRPEFAVTVQVERFLREIDITRELRHPNIMPLFDSGRVRSSVSLGGEHIYYTTPFVSSGTVRERLRQDTRLPIPEALGIATAVADALQYAHEMGVIHRDVKPSNIFLPTGRPALLSDFGLARAIIGAEAEHNITASGVIVGTPSYMSPEQLVSDPLDARSDQYTFACVLYEMLVGQPPFGAGGAQAVMMRHLSERPSSMRTVRDTIPESVDHAVLRALEKTPADRFPSMREFADALRLDRPDAQVPMWGKLPIRIDRGTCFVLMPFGEQDDLQETYRDHIVPCLESCGFRVYRADDIFSHREVIRDIWVALGSAELVIADVTGRNPNVFYELGMAHAIGKDVIILAQRSEDIPFDVTHLRYIKYEYTPRGVVRLKDALLRTVETLRTDKSRSEA